MFIFLLIAGVLLSKLGYYQLIKGQEIARQAVAMRSRQVELKEYNRGEILDRNLLSITGTRVSTALYCLPREMIREHPQGTNTSANVTEELREQTLVRVTQILSDICGQKESQRLNTELKQAIESGKPFIRVAANLTPEETALINSSQLSGIVAAPVVRRYREDGFLSHLIGYCSKGQNQEGISGLEKCYDNILCEHTTSHELTSVLDARGIAIQGLMFKLRNEQEQHRGALVLTIDKRIQEIIEQAMNEQVKTGAIVVMDVDSKEILALASRPTFNPYGIEKIVKHDQNGSLNNRALMAYYPGSIFKILVTAAALEEKLVSPEEQFNCQGSYIFNDEVSIPCLREKGHGKINFSQAFALSCNPSFIETGLRLKRTGLLEYADRLHLTDENLLGYGNYQAGSYITIENADPAIGNACLGQEGVMLTPLQICNMVATVADNGRYAPPILVRYTIDREGNKQMLTRPTKEQVISPQSAQILQQLMEKVINEGTGKTASLNEVSVAGKTATSQTGNFDEKGNEILNTWFTGFFPADNPRWAIVVLVEGGKSGAENAAPVFKAIAQQMLQ
jgi:peptidoglycan glycosyltransferase/penicillin-binding protein 2